CLVTQAEYGITLGISGRDTVKVPVHVQHEMTDRISAVRAELLFAECVQILVCPCPVLADKLEDDAVALRVATACCGAEEVSTRVHRQIAFGRLAIGTICLSTE